MGMQPGKFAKPRRNLPHPEDQGHVDPEQSARLQPVGRDRSFRRLDVGQNALAGFQIAAPGIGQRQPSRGAMKQSRPEPALERREVLGHHGLRQPHGASGRRQRAGGCNLGEHLQSREPIRHA
jgi:hypothetical protein